VTSTPRMRAQIPHSGESSLTFPFSNEGQWY
jgi:hypothetical protein